MITTIARGAAVSLAVLSLAAASPAGAIENAPPRAPLPEQSCTTLAQSVRDAELFLATSARGRYITAVDPRTGDATLTVVIFGAPTVLTLRFRDDCLVDYWTTPM